MYCIPSRSEIVKLWEAPTPSERRPAGGKSFLQFQMTRQATSSRCGLKSREIPRDVTETQEVAVIQQV